MAITAKSNKNMAILTQQRMRWVGGAFTTTGTGVNVSVNDFKVITAVIVSYAENAPASGDIIYVNETYDVTNQKYTLNTAGVLRLARLAGTTSGQKFNLLILGY